MPPVSLGRRSVGWLEHETDMVLRGLISGRTDIEIKELVKEVIALRADLCDQSPLQSAYFLNFSPRAEGML